MIATIQDVAERVFDYIIIGGGTAGLTLAAALTEDPTTSVLILEAGKANINDPTILRPFSYGSHFSNPDQAWPHKTIKQKFSLGTEAPWGRGKGLGGSSSINFMCYLKPPAEDINDIELLGNPGWNWENFNRVLQKVEGFVAPTEEALAKAQINAGLWSIGTDGPLKISFPKTISPVDAQIHQAMKNVGLPAAPDPYGGNPRGYFMAPNNYDPKDHTRTYAVTAFYLPNKDRPNMTVLLSSLVNRVLTDSGPSGMVVAKGVEFTHDGKTYIVNAKKEVIVCAGTLKSPQILELSGIGNKDILRKLNIPVKVDLPGVGENVQEHLFALLTYEIKDGVDFDSMNLLLDPKVAAKNVELHKYGLGMFTQGIINFTFVPLECVTDKASKIISEAKEKYTKKMETSPAWKRDQYVMQLARLERGGLGSEFIHFPSPAIFLRDVIVPGKSYMSLAAGINHAWSRGTIHCTLNDPTIDPEYDPHYFEEDIDSQILVENMRLARKIARTSPLTEVLGAEISPGPDVTTDEQLAEYGKKWFSTTWHTASSCSMLPRDRGGVVDSNLKVYGTENLRVVDLSILPIHVAAHTQATVYAIAEYAAEIIKGQQ